MIKPAKLYGYLLHKFLEFSFPFWQWFGFHIVPNSYYQPIPDTRRLKGSLWTKINDNVGINMNIETQLKLLADFERFKPEYERFARHKTDIPHKYYIRNYTFEEVDAEILYCMIRYFKPKRIFEIGSGNSTYLSAEAVLKNREEASDCELVAIEPHPNRVLKNGFLGLARIMAVNVQDVPLEEFTKLEKNDFLFIDSSHVLSIGSDVQYEFLHIIPRLNKGVIIHFHDIYFPAEYPREYIFKKRWFWNEQYILQAFLSFNESFELLWAGSFMHLNYPDKLEAAFSSYRRNETWPGSFWIQKIK